MASVGFPVWIGNAGENLVNDWSANPFNIEESVINEMFTDSDSEDEDFEGSGEDEAVTDADPAERPTAAADMTALPDETEWVEEDRNDPNGFHFTGQPGLKTQEWGWQPVKLFWSVFHRSGIWWGGRRKQPVSLTAPGWQL